MATDSTIQKAVNMASAMIAVSIQVRPMGRNQSQITQPSAPVAPSAKPKTKARATYTVKVARASGRGLGGAAQILRRHRQGRFGRHAQPVDQRRVHRVHL